jgi:hypothetical protein
VSSSSSRSISDAKLVRLIMEKVLSTARAEALRLLYLQ